MLYASHNLAPVKALAGCSMRREKKLEKKKGTEFLYGVPMLE